MVLSGKLYAPANYHKSLRAQLAAAYSNSKVEYVVYCPGETAVPAELKSCPADVAPLFHGNDGTTLFDTNAIAYFLGNKQIRGGEGEHFVTQWANFTDHVLLPSIASWLYPLLGATSYNKQQVGKAQENTGKALSYLNTILSTKTFFVGEHITQADLTIFSATKMLLENLLDEAARKSYPNLVRWFTTVANQPEVKKIVGEVKLCVKPVVFDPKKLPQQDSKPNEKKAKQPKQKQLEPKKKEKKEAGDEDLDDELAAKPSKNPLADLPVGTLNYDEFKKVYSNEDIRKVAIPFFWEKFDPTTDSIWYGEYNYPEELRLVFMSANLIAGTFQRLEKMQKYAFAVVNVFGEDKNSTIGGVWVWRGTDLVFNHSRDLQVDYESYTWTKLDHTDPKTRTMIENYFARDCDIDGKKIADSNVFK